SVMRNFVEIFLRVRHALEFSHGQDPSPLRNWPCRLMQGETQWTTTSKSLEGRSIRNARFLPWTWSARKRYVTEARLPPSPPSNPQKFAYPCRCLLGGCLPRVSASLVHDRAPRPMKFHHHSGSLFSPLCEGRPVPMHLECGVVSVHFVRENFRIVVLG